MLCCAQGSIHVALPFFSRNLGVRRLAVLLAAMGAAAGAFKVRSDFRALEGQRYWAKYVRSWVSACPNSRLIEGRRGEILLVAEPKALGLSDLGKFGGSLANSSPSAATPKSFAADSLTPDEILKLAPPASPHIIRSFGYSSPDPPRFNSYGVLALMIVAYATVPFLCPHAVAWIVAGFRTKPSTQH